MVVLIELLASYAPYIYLACGLVALYQLYRLLQVRADRRQAVFSLERERAVRNLYGIFTVALVLVLVMGATYFAGSTLPRAVAQPTTESALPEQFSLNIIPTNTPLPVTPSATPTGTIAPAAEPPTTTVPATTTVTVDATLSATDATVAAAVAATLAAAAGAPAATPTAPPAAATATSNPVASLLTPTAVPPPTDTPTPEPPTPEPTPVAAAPAPACGEGNNITSPGNGSVVGGVFTLVGTAAHDAFDFYKVEFAPGADATGGFTYLADGRGPVYGGTLASVDTRGFGNGPWTFQLTVVDQTGNYPDPCRVTVVVQN